MAKKVTADDWLEPSLILGVGSYQNSPHYYPRKTKVNEFTIVGFVRPEKKVHAKPQRPRRKKS